MNMIRKVLIGTAEIAKNVYNLTAGFRELGIETHSLIFKKQAFYQDLEYTLSGLDFLKDTTYHRRSDGTVGVKTSRAFGQFVKQYDLFIFVSGASLLPRLIDLPILKQMGKLVISRHCGSEVRDGHLAQKFWSAYGRPYSLYQQDLTDRRVDIRHEHDLLDLGRYQTTPANRMHNARISELYADLVTCGPPSFSLALRPYCQTGPPLDHSMIPFRIPRRRVPVIVHAPSSTAYKRTDLIISLLRELQEEGLAFHLDFIHQVPNSVVLEKLADADILIDELACGTGLLAYEGAAAGCAVLSSHDGISSPLPRNRPVLDISPETFKHRVRKVVEDLNYRTRLAVMGREFMDSGVASPQGIAKTLLQDLQRAQKGDADLYPTLFANEACPEPGERLPEYLKDRTLKVLKKHGAHPGTDLPRLMHAGLLPQVDEQELDTIPRWDTSRLTEEGPWVITGPGATHGAPSPLPQPEDYSPES